MTIDPNKLNRIIQDQASEEELKAFDKMVQDSSLEHTPEDFTESVLGKVKADTYSQKVPLKLTTVALALVVMLSLIIIMLYDSFSLPTMTDPMLEQWMVPANESTGIIKQVIMIVDALLMLILIDKFALSPYFRKKNYS